MAPLVIYSYIGYVYLVVSCFLPCVAGCVVGKETVKPKRHNYGAWVRTLLFINAGIQFIMAMTFLIYAVILVIANNDLVFEAIALCQQLSYHLTILSIGGIYRFKYYHHHINKIKSIVVCSNQIKRSFPCFLFVSRTKDTN